MPDNRTRDGNMDGRRTEKTKVVDREDASVNHDNDSRFVERQNLTDQLLLCQNCQHKKMKSKKKKVNYIKMFRTPAIAANKVSTAPPIKSWMPNAHPIK